MLSNLAKRMECVWLATAFERSTTPESAGRALLPRRTTRLSHPAVKSASKRAHSIRFATVRAFTLIELMVVVGIMGIIMTIAIPGVYRFVHPNPLQKGVDEVREACKNAREMAVMRGTITVLVIDLKSRTFSVQASSAPAPRVDSISPDGFIAEPTPRAVSTFEPTGAGKSYQLSDHVRIEGLGINGLDYTEDDRAEIRFYPKGTSDEFSIVLLSDNNERRNIWLDAITGYPEFEVDPQKFRVR